MQPFLALITPLASTGEPQPPGIWGPTDPRPSHPIAPGGRPPGIWGGPPLYPDQGLPGPQPHPEHPIVIPPGSLGPGVPTHPIYIPSPPVHPSHPIVIPPEAIAPGVPTQPIYIPPGIWGPTDPRPSHPIAPGGGGGQQPPGYWGGVAPPLPTHPIVIPPMPPVGDTDKALVLVVTGEDKPVWFLIDEAGQIKPPTHPQPKPSTEPAKK